MALTGPFQCPTCPSTNRLIRRRGCALWAWVEAQMEKMKEWRKEQAALRKLVYANVKCECGADKVGGRHSSWCKKAPWWRED